MLVSVIYSSRERLEYLRAGLLFQTFQTLLPDEFEVVVVDDGSDADYEPILEEFRGKLQMQWVRYDRTKHPIYAEMNPDGKPLLPPENEPLAYHTPAYSHNLGARIARGEVVCITQPEVLMRENALYLGAELARKTRSFIYGKPWMSTPEFRTEIFRRIALDPKLQDFPRTYDELKKIPGYTGGGDGGEGFRYETYWWLSFIERRGYETIGGVDEEYLRGVYGEDDDFRVRAHRAGWRQKIHPEIEGIHLYHGDLGAHWDRAGERWKVGAGINRARFDKGRLQGRHHTANQNRVWGDPSLIMRHKVYGL